MVDEIAIPDTQNQELIKLVTDGLESRHSKRAYERALTDFFAWWEEQKRPGLNKATVQSYKTYLSGQGLAPSSINQRLSAVKKLAAEAADNGFLAGETANGIARVKGAKMSGVRSGNWLTQDKAQALLDAPDLTTLKGLRDRALLAVLLGAGLRRSESAALEFSHIQQREGRWVIVDLVGKGGRVRTVALPSFAKSAIDNYAQTAGIESGFVFRPINKGDNLAGDGMSPQAIYNTVLTYAGQVEVDIAAHDLRRTFAKLAHRGGADLAQISLTLGHASLNTTQRYLGLDLDLVDAPCDKIGLK